MSVGAGTRNGSIPSASAIRSHFAATCQATSRSTSSASGASRLTARVLTPAPLPREPSACSARSRAATKPGAVTAAARSRRPSGVGSGAEPSQTGRPGRGESTITRSARNSASSTSWVTSRTVRGSSSSTVRSHDCRSARVIASSAANGSSSSSTGLPVSSVRRKATRWRIPPESSAGRARSKPARPTRSNIGCGLRRGPRAREAPASRRASAALSIARSQGSSRSRCGM